MKLFSAIEQIVQHVFVITYGTVASKTILLDSFSSFQIFSFSVNFKELLSNGPYAS